MLIGPGDNILPGRGEGLTKPPLKNLSRFTVRHFIKSDLGGGIQALDVAQVVDATLDNPRGTFKKEVATLEKSFATVNKSIASVKDDTSYIRKEIKKIEKLIKKNASGVASPTPFNPVLTAPEYGAGYAAARAVAKSAISLGSRVVGRLALPVAAGFGLAWLLTTKEGNQVISTFAQTLDDMKHGISWQSKMRQHVQGQQPISTQGLTTQKMREIEAGGSDFYKKQQEIIKKWQQQFLKPQSKTSPKKLPGSGNITKNQDYSNKGSSRTGARVPDVMGNNKSGSTNQAQLTGPKATAFQKTLGSSSSTTSTINQPQLFRGQNSGSSGSTVKDLLHKGRDQNLSSDEIKNIVSDHIQNSAGEGNSQKITPPSKTGNSTQLDSLSTPEDVSRITETEPKLNNLNKTVLPRTESSSNNEQDINDQPQDRSLSELERAVLTTKQEYTSSTTKKFQRILSQKSQKMSTIPEEMQMNRRLGTPKDVFVSKSALAWAKPWIDAIGASDPNFKPSEEAKKETLAARKEFDDWTKRWYVNSDDTGFIDSQTGMSATPDEWKALNQAQINKILKEYPLVSWGMPISHKNKVTYINRIWFWPNESETEEKQKLQQQKAGNLGGSLTTDIPFYKIKPPTQSELDTANRYLNPVAIPSGMLGLDSGNSGVSDTGTAIPASPKPAKLNGGGNGEPTDTTLPSLDHSRTTPGPDQSLGATPPGPVGDPSNGRIGQAYRYLKSIGMSDAAAAGVIGSMQQESYKRLDPTAHNASGAYGIGQWTSYRQGLFKKVFGHPIQQSTFQEQLEFMGWEFKHTEKKAFNKINAAAASGGAKAGAYAAGAYYERPGAGANYSAREQYAAEIEANSSNYATPMQNASSKRSKKPNPYANYKLGPHEAKAYSLLQSIPSDMSKWTEADKKTFIQARKWATPAVYAQLYDSRNGVSNDTTPSDQISQKKIQIVGSKRGKGLKPQSSGPSTEQSNLSPSNVPSWLSAHSKKEITGVNSGLAQTEIDAANALGFKFQVNQGLRTQQEANANARQGIGVRDSQHLYGAANDIQLIDDNGQPISIPRNERNPSNPLYRKYMAFASEVQKLGKQRGLHLRWGGNFRSGVTKDYVHFDMGLGYGQANPNQNPYDPNAIQKMEAKAVPVQPMPKRLTSSQEAQEEVPVSDLIDNSISSRSQALANRRKVDVTPSTKPVPALSSVDETTSNILKKSVTSHMSVPQPKVPSSIDLAIAKTVLPPKKSRTATAFYRVKNRVKAGGFPLDLPLGDPDTAQSMFA